MVIRLKQCTSCQHILSEDDHAHRCMVCGTELCDLCSYFGLCEQHYYRMLKPDQRRLRELYMQANRIRTIYGLFEIFCGGLVGFLLLDLIHVALSGFNVLFENFWIYFMGFILIICGIMSIRRSFYGIRREVTVLLDQIFKTEVYLWEFPALSRSIEEYN